MARINALNSMDHMKRTTNLSGGLGKWLAKIFAGICLDAGDAAFRYRFKQALDKLVEEIDSILEKHVGVLLLLVYDLRTLGYEDAEVRDFVQLNIVGRGNERRVVLEAAFQSSFRSQNGLSLRQPRGCNAGPFCKKKSVYLWVNRFGTELIDPETNDSAWVDGVLR